MSLSEKQKSLLKQRLRQKGITKSTQPITEKIRLSQAPASYSQRAMWMTQNAIEGGGAYNIVSAMKMQGNMNILALEAAINFLCKRHDILRTVLQEKGGIIEQKVCEYTSISVPLIDCCELPEAEHQSKVEQIVSQEAKHFFNLQDFPLFRVQVIRFSPDSHVLIFNMHHCISDGWSQGNIAQEIGNYYNFFSQHGISDSVPGVTELPMQYADFANWQNEYLNGPQIDAQLSYWKNYLNNCPKTHQLPVKQSRSGIDKNDGARYFTHLSAGELSAVKAFSSSRQITLFNLLQTALAATVSKFSGAEQQTIGCINANRHHQGVKDLIGCFVGTTVIRNNFSGEASFSDVLYANKAHFNRVISEPDIPFELILDALQVQRSKEINPIFQISFVLQNFHKQSITLNGLSLEPLDLGNALGNYSKFELSLHASESSDGLELMWEYNRQLFDEHYISTLAAAWRNLLVYVCQENNAERPLSRLLQGTDMLSLNLTSDCISTPAWLPNLDAGSSVIDWFRHYAQDNPNKVALLDKDERLTYKQLDVLSSQLAHQLLESGVAQGDYIGLLAHRHWQSIVSVMGILKAGCAYVPIDSDLPDDRVRVMLQDSGAKALLTDSDRRFEDCVSRCFRIDKEDWVQGLSYFPNAVPKLEEALDCTSPFYMIFTSGTTGRPKGVMLNHNNIKQFLLGFTQRHDITPGLRYGYGNGMATDLGNSILFSALFCGGKLHLYDQATMLKAEEFQRRLAQEPVDLMTLTPTHFIALQEQGKEMALPCKTLILAGEALSPTLAKAILTQIQARELECQLVNLYGPTETTIGSLTHIFDNQTDFDQVSIGKPLPGVRIRITDKAKNMLPTGAVGELWIGGDIVADGYVGRDELNIESFINIEGARYYRTGDLANISGDGLVYFHGRRDKQVKIRGYRVELSEVESRLNELPTVQLAAVVCKKDASDELLVAYILPVEAGENVDIQALRNALRNTLPHYMLPQHYEIIDAIPRTASGKIDYAALPEIIMGEEQLQSPIGQLENQLALIWQSVIRCPVLGREQNFYALGGDSMKAIIIAEQCREQGIAISVRDIFSYPTIAELSQFIEASSALHVESSELSEELPKPFQLISVADKDKCDESVVDAYPLSSLQEAMTMHYLMKNVEMPLYQQVTRRVVKGDFKLSAFKTALSILAERHPVLRTSFALKGFSQPLQLVHDFVEVPFRVVDIRSMSESEQKQTIQQHINKWRTEGLKLEQAPLLKWLCYQLGDEHFELIWMNHHAILDGWSIGNFLVELAGEYNNVVQGKVRERQRQVLGFNQLLAQELKIRVSPKQSQDFWAAYLKGFTFSKLPRLPMPVTTKDNTPLLSVPLSGQLIEKLRVVCRELEVPLKTVMFAAYTKVLSLFTGQPDITTGYCMHKRSASAGGEKALGLFVTTLPLRMNVSDLTWTQLIDVCLAEEQRLWSRRFDPLNLIQQQFENQTLFEVNFNFYEYNSPAIDEQRQPSKQGGAQILLPSGSNKVVNFNEFTLTSNFVLGLDDAELMLTYDPAELAITQVQQYANYIVLALQNIAEDYSAKPYLLSAQDLQRQQVEFNQTITDLPYEQCLHALFLSTVQAQPDAVAVTDQDGSISYKELFLHAYALRNVLIAEQVEVEELVAVILPKGRWQVVATLAVMMAGGAYLPIETSWPSARVEKVLLQGQVKKVVCFEQDNLTLPHYVQKFAPDYAIESLIDMSGLNDLVAKCESFQKPDNLAYVIFTSGSTGTPKGVAIEHRAVVNTLLDLNQRFSIGQRDKVLAVSALSFDLSVFDIFGLLAVGGEVVMPTSGREIEPLHWAELCQQHGITIWNTVPTSVQLLIEAFDSKVSQHVPIRLIMMSGDRIAPKLPAKAFAAFPRAELFSLGGATEASIWSISFPILGDTSLWSCVPYGKALANQSFYVLDDNKNFCPIGVAGELYIGGVGVAREYYGDSERSESSFVDHQFLPAPLYRTGDMGRHLPDGNIEFLGRLDNQVKLGGYRVELGEIEECLNRSEFVKDALVTLSKNSQAHNQVVGYVVLTQEAQGQITGKELRDEVRTKLPAYMVPVVVVVMDAFPLTANGKLNRKDLPDVSESELDSNSYVPPQNQTQRMLCELWEKLLGTDKLSIEDNLFTLGADSITVLTSISRAHHIGLSYELADIYKYPTIASLAGVTTALTQPHVEQKAVTGKQALLPAMSWFKELQLPNPSHFNQAILIKTPKEFNPDSLHSILPALAHKHDILRLRFDLDSSEAEYVPVGEKSWLDATEQIDCGEFESPNQAPQFLEQCQRIQRNLCISTGDILRIAHFSFANDGRLLLVAHHLAVDVVSWRILLNDLSIAYQQWLAKDEINLPAKTVSVQEWAQMLRQWQATPEFCQQRAYWQRAENDRQAPLSALLGYTEDGTLEISNQVNDTQKVHFSVPGLVNDSAMLHLLNTYQMSYVEFLVAVLVNGITSWQGIQGLTLDLEGHGRESLFPGVDLSDTIGWFTSMYPVNFSLHNVDCENALLKLVKQQLRAVPNGGIGYGVCRYLADEPLQQSVPVDILFNYLGKVATQNQQELFAPVNESIGSSIDPNAQRSCVLQVTAVTVDDKTHITLEFNSKHFVKSEIHELEQRIKRAAEQLVQGAEQQNRLQWIPQDFPLTTIEQSSLDKLTDGYPHLANLYPVTPVQQGILLHSQLQVGTYINQMYLVLRGTLNINALQQAWQHLCQQFEVLRTAFVELDSASPLQLVVSDVELDWEELDWREASQQQEREFKVLQSNQANVAFDFSSPSLMRLKLVQLDNEEYRLLWTYHHVLLDGWSLPILLKNLVEKYHYYNDVPRDKPISSIEVDTGFYDYVGWLQQQNIVQAQTYWQKTLSAVTAPSLLASSVELGSASTAEGSESLDGDLEQSLVLNKKQSDALNQFCRQQGTTLSNVLQLTLGYLLQRYLGLQQVVFGVTVAGRPAELNNIESSVGLFINTVPVVFDYGLSDSIERVLQANHQAQLQRTQYSYLSPATIQQLSALGAGESIFDVLLVVENFPVDEVLDNQHDNKSLRIDGLTSVESTNYGLTIVVHEHNGINLKFRHHCSSLSKAAVAQVKGDFEGILAYFTEHARIDVSELNLSKLPIRSIPAQKEAKVQKAEEVDVHSGQDLYSRFATMARRFPNHVALTHEEKNLTYQQLNDRVTRWSSALLEYEVAGKPVALWFDKSIELVCAMLAVSRCGGFYVPLDSSAPNQRNQLILDDVHPALILCDKEPDVAAVSEPPWVTTATLDNHNLTLQDTDIVNFKGDANSPLYVIYTSGTTGRPKGVQVSHRNLLRLLDSTTPQFQFDENDVWTLFHSPAFDFSVWEIWGALLFGGRLVIVPSVLARDTMSFRQLLIEQQVSVLNLTPSAFARLVEVDLSESECLTHLSTVIFGGEAINLPALKAWKNKYSLQQPCLINMYGITETTVHVTYHQIRDEEIDEGLVSIGSPIEDLQIRLVNELGLEVPLGCTGEMYIAGGGVAIGYLNQPSLTQERFTHLEGDTCNRWYRSGDLARRGPDGQYFYMGRADEQVKLRGYRIEPEEVASVCCVMDSIDNAVCLLVRDPEPELVLFVVTNEVDSANLVSRTYAYLREALPVYMLPAGVVIVEQIPINANGKVDKKELLAHYTKHDDVCEQSLEFENETQRTIKEIWSDVLQRELIGPNSDFFILGGHSLKLAQVVTRIQQQFATEVSFTQLYQNPTIAGQARLVAECQNSKANAYSAIPLLNEEQRHNGVVMTAAQRRIWFTSQNHEQNIAYNMPYLLEVEGGLCADLVRQTLSVLVQRHEVLRTVYFIDAGEPKQKVMQGELFEFERLTSKSGSEAWQYVIEQSVRPFDLNNGPVFRSSVIEFNSNGQTYHWLFFNLHHIACDAWSLTTLITEFCAIYEACRQKTVASLEPLTVQVADIAVWQNSEPQTSARESHKRYWKEYFHRPQSPLTLPYTEPDSCHAGSHSVGDSVRFTLDAELTSRLDDFNLRHGLTNFMTLFSTYGLLLTKLANNQEVTIGTPVGTRERPEFESLIGFFNNTLAIRLQTGPELTVAQYLNLSKSEVLNCFEHQNVPLDEVLDELSLVRSDAAQSLFSVLFVLQNVNVSPFSITGLKTKQKSLPRSVAKFELTLSMYQADEQMHGELEFDPRRFSYQQIQRFTDYFVSLLKQIVEQPTQLISNLSLLSGEEAHMTVADMAPDSMLDLDSIDLENMDIADLENILSEMD
ncbi:amino acid adenylation domain-containing protein [Pseudoalteromonas piscicida]|uniref:amino acid adenylation domain-containing protein n=1 Tax=Pseudoalteromonas piscicida TaxID=43662 RepID=UPI00309B9749